MRFFLIIALCFTGYAAEVWSDKAEFKWDMVSRHDFPSPGNQRVATVFEMCCYCTTGYYPELTVRGPGEKIGDRGNVFEGEPGDTVTVKWMSPTNLLVEQINITRKIRPPIVTNVAGVKIEIHPRSGFDQIR